MVVNTKIAHYLLNRWGGAHNQYQPGTCAQATTVAVASFMKTARNEGSYTGRFCVFFLFVK